MVSFPRYMLVLSVHHIFTGTFVPEDVKDISLVQLLGHDALWHHGLQHARLPCPSPTPRAYSNSCLSSRWYYPAISSSVIPFSFHLQFFPASGSFPMSHFFTSGGQSTGVSASTLFLPINMQNRFPLGWTGWISLQSKRLSSIFSKTTVQKINSLALSLLYTPTLTSIHDYWKNQSFG